MIRIAETAAKKISTLKSEEQRSEGDLLRVEIQKGGCSGLSYKMNFESSLRDGDKVFEQHGQKIVVDTNSFMYLAGMELDYEGGLNGKGFIFNNPNATKSCGCGSSFNVSGGPKDTAKKCS